MAPLVPRQHDIMQLARAEGRVSVDALAAQFGVSPQTIRSDLKTLASDGLLQRIHGGAVVVSGVENFAYEARRKLAALAKQRIGQMAANMIPNNCSLILNIGTTTEQVAKAMRGKKGLMIVTNNINVVNILRNDADIEVVVAGGSVRRSDGGVVGESAEEQIKQFKVDFAIIGSSAIDGDGTLLDYDQREVKIAKAILESARHTILVADHMKFNRTAPVRIGHISQVNTFVTDQAPPENIAQICTENITRVLVAQ
jgi:DeoR family transcriptional regulator, glycerol-3-phosphate regulon repressor